MGPYLLEQPKMKTIEVKLRIKDELYEWHQKQADQDGCVSFNEYIRYVLLRERRLREYETGQ